MYDSIRQQRAILSNLKGKASGSPKKKPNAHNCTTAANKKKQTMFQGLMLVPARSAYFTNAHVPTLTADQR